jgi:hypothetical protein
MYIDMTKVEIYHRPGRGASIDDLLVGGLKSAKGKIEDYVDPVCFLTIKE